MTSRRFAALLVVLLMLLSGRPVHAFPRMPFADAEVVDRSELILVGAIKEGSVLFVPHDDATADCMCTYEHHATLAVRQVIKGHCTEKEIPVIIYYGLDLITNNQLYRTNTGTHPTATQPTSLGPIELEDTGGEMGPPMLTDARQDAIWFLRRRSGPYGRDVGKGDFGITDPEDVKPLDLKDYITCYFAAEPEAAVRAQLQKQPAIAERAMAFLDHRELERIGKIADVPERVQRLIPYYGNSSTKYEAGQQLIAAGPLAGPYLLGVYNRTWDWDERNAIILLWGRIRWPGCADLLIDLLKSEDAFWASQKLEAKWWSSTADPALTKARQDRYGATYYAVFALHQLREPRAKAAIELTRRRWATIPFDNAQIIEACDQFLKDAATQPARADQ